MTETAAPERIETERLLLRRPTPSDAGAMFERYSADPEVTRYVGWPEHRSEADTRLFLAFSDEEWERWRAGPYLIDSRQSGALLGSTGLALETPWRAATGYVLARDSWGRGYATEALRAVVGVAREIGIRRLYALCHPEHAPSAHVLEKCGFELEGTLRRYAEFPNLEPGVPGDVQCWALLP